MPKISRVVGGVEQAMSIKFNNAVYEMQRAGRRVIVLSLGEAFFDIPLYPLSDLPFPALYHYSHSRGTPVLRSKLARYYGDQYGVAVDPETEMVVTAGSKAAVHMTLMSIVDPGDEVLVIEPAWVSYTEQIRLCHGVPVGVPWSTPLTDIERHFTARTRAIIVNTPHNPTGRVYTRNDLQFLVELARRRGVWLLSDEAYSDFTTPGQFVSAGALDPDKANVAVFNSMSKNYGISGWRIGYVIGSAALISSVLKVQQHLVTCAPTVLEYYLEAHFEQLLAITKPQIADVIAKRAEIVRFVHEAGLSCLPGEATFYLFVSIAPSRLGSEEFCLRLLEEHAVCVVPGIGYGASCDAFVRLSVGTESLDDIRDGVRRIKRLVDATSGRSGGSG